MEKIKKLKKIFKKEKIDAYIVPKNDEFFGEYIPCLLYTSPSPRDRSVSRMPSSA